MTVSRMLLRSVALLVLGGAFLVVPAHAHSGHEGAGFLNGLVHPFSGIDHLLAMLAVGLLAARVAGRRRWLLPAGFVAFMLVGGTVALAGFGMEVAAVEWAVAASVLVFGAMLFGLPVVPVVASVVVVAAFAVFHGFAHVAEMTGASPGAFMAGMILGTGVLHAAGFAGGRALLRAGKGKVRYVRAAGACLTVTFLAALSLW